MKKILLVYAGGTICSQAENGQYRLNTDSAEKVLLSSFKYDNFNEELFEDSKFDSKNHTLSENMTPLKWECIIKHLKTFDLNNYQGVIIFHGTDTLAYTATMLSFLMLNAPVPIMLVAANQPPTDLRSNAADNFKVAMELIKGNISPNVYVPYRNVDKTMYLHLGSTIMQSPNYSENFYNATDDNRFKIDMNNICSEYVLNRCRNLSKNRISFESAEIKDFDLFSNNILLITPYVGLDYSRISLDNIEAIVHGTFHSGTICVERNNEEQDYTKFSMLWLLAECQKRNIPVFAAPSKLTTHQYSSVFDAVYSGNLQVLDMTIEAAYSKLLLGVSCGLKGIKLIKFMKNEINNEIVN